MFDLVLVFCLIVLDASPSATELLKSFTAEFWENFGYTHLENVVLKALKLCTISLTKVSGMEVWISSGIIVCLYD